MHHPSVVLLGPQRLQPTLNRVVESLKLVGPIAAVTAGWEERECEDQELREHLHGRSVNLRLYERVEDVIQRDPELLHGMRERADQLREQHELYRLRLGHALEAARDLLKRETQESYATMLAAEREGAIEAVRELDSFHFRRVAALHEEFETRYRPLERDSVARHRQELARTLADVCAVCIAGGHVVMLLHRMRLLALLELVPAKTTLIAWSAGAMVLADRVVLFHDDPPQGKGNAEVLEPGLAAFDGLVPLPHAKKRLRLHDAQRVALMARRFAPARCIAFDPLTRMDWNGKSWSGTAGTLRLDPRGVLLPSTTA
jgi:hypothetical protein